MTSLFAQRGRLSNRTHDAYRPSGHPHRDIHERLRFYLLYLEEVIPIGLTVRHIPADRASVRANVPRNSRYDSIHTSESREEIQLLTYGGKIFMSGIVSMDRNPTLLEEVAGDEAYTKWDNGDFMRDGDNWRFFTGNVLIRLFRSHHGDEWRMPREMDPIWDVEEVAEYLQQEFDRIERYH